MAKIYGLNGVITGKQGNQVFAVRNGEQIVRKYQPIVLDPKSEAQTEARAKLKLMSQLSAVMARVIAIPREGTASPRNLFVRLNYDAVTYNNGVADIALLSVQLTKSVNGLPPLAISESNVQLASAVTTQALSRVVYIKFVRQTDGTLRFVGSYVATEPGTGNLWPANVSSVTADNVIYGYGVLDMTETARVKFANMQTISAETVAKVIATRVLTEKEVMVTETRSIFGGNA